MDLSLGGRCALVTGGGGGLGSAISRVLAAEGANVAVADISLSAAQQTAAEIERAGGGAMALEWDIARIETFAQHLQVIGTRFGDVDVLVNLTGGPPPSPAHGVDPQLWSDHFRSMVLGVIHLTDLVIPAMRERGWGRIITSTSSGVVAPIPHLAVSNALRMSLVGWSKTLSRDVGADGVTVNVVVPGRIATQRIRALDEAHAEREQRPVDEVARDSIAGIPLARYGRPEEYGDAVAFLASQRASYITGSILRVDGGLIASV